MKIAYSVDAMSNDTHMFPDFFSEKKDPSVFCSKCGRYKDILKIDPDVKIKKKNFDISCTYEGITIISTRFKEFCITHGFNNLIIKDLNRHKDLFALFVNEHYIELDTERSAYTMKDYCDQCKMFKEVFGGIDMKFKSVFEPLLTGFYQSDIVFSTGNLRRREMFAGVETYKAIKTEKFKGFYGNAITT